MKVLHIVFIFYIFGLNLAAQTTQNFSIGTSYANGQYYNLENNTTTSLLHSAWDIAFSVYGSTDGGIFINEGASYSGTAPKLYIIPNKSFTDNILAIDVGAELRNDEISWSNGSFNSVKVSSNWADYGWGVYNMGNHKIEGSNLYAIELGNGNFKKLSIDTLTSGTYYFKYADFDGSNLQQQSIVKSAFPNQTLAYFSFATNSTVNAEPTTGWDWLFTRYETTVDNSGVPTPYTVGGILLNKGVEAVIADGINPATVDIVSYATDSDSLTIIGHDWKSYSFSSGWIMDADRVYFVKTADSTLYKIQFIDFQGSSTGQGTFLQTTLGKWTAIEQTETYSALESFNIFPNPATDYLNLSFSLEEKQMDMQVQIVNYLGQFILEKTIQGNSGLNALIIDSQGLNAGSYVLTLQSKDVFISKKISIN